MHDYCITKQTQAYSKSTVITLNNILFSLGLPAISHLLYLEITLFKTVQPLTASHFTYTTKFEKHYV